LIVALAVLSLGAGMAASADPLQDRKDIDEVQHALDAIKEVERASEANHYDISGHAKKAEELMREAEKELNLARSARRASQQTGERPGRS
jgi:hypothetical protein